MLGFAPLSAAPLGATGEFGVAYDAILDEAAAASQFVSSFAAFLATQADTVVGADVAQVVASTFSATADETAAATADLSLTAIFNISLDESAAASDDIATSVDFAVQVEDSVFGDSSVSVAASVFNAQVLEEVGIVDTFLASAVFFATITGSATAIDQIIGGFLWEIINDSQSGSWGGVNDSQASTWGTINASQSSAWSAVNASQANAWGVTDDSQSAPWNPVKTQS